MRAGLLFFLILFTYIASAQGPFSFKVQKLDAGKVRVEWTNPYGESLIQLNVQRSYDSVRNFQTVFVPLSPELPQNGYIDDNMGNMNGSYYRIFYVLDGGAYYFTKSQRITMGFDATDSLSADVMNENIQVTIHDEDTVIAVLKYTDYRRFRDSIVNYTRDTLYSLTDADIMLKRFQNNNTWVPSINIFLSANGYININLPLYASKAYRLKIMDENRKPLFTINKINESPLILDKSNFIHSGWFYFDLYEDNRLKERNKFYLPKDF